MTTRPPLVINITITRISIARISIARALLALTLIAVPAPIPAYLWWQKEQTKKVWWLFRYDTINRPNTILMRKKVGRYKTKEACYKGFERELHKHPLRDSSGTLSMAYIHCSYIQPDRKPSYNGKKGDYL